MKKKSAINVSTETLAAFLDGNATAQESIEIFDMLPKDAELRELLHISQSVDTELGCLPLINDTLPLKAMVATSRGSNSCSLECEKYVLDRCGIKYDAQKLLKDSIRHGWQKEAGTCIYNIGRHCENMGLQVKRHYMGTITDIEQAINEGRYVIVALDGGELLNNSTEEKAEDLRIGEKADHAVVVTSYCSIRQSITVFDPNSPFPTNTYSIQQFTDAWNDSKNYIITITPNNMKTYNPNPIDLSDVALPEDLKELREAIAENAHDIWAIDRQEEGWTYGPVRDEYKKETPCMVPYSELPEKEKEYDRKMAMRTIKLMMKLGYDLIKREETDLYKVLKQRIQNSNEEFHCRKCGNVIYKHQVFCDWCGERLDIDWDKK